MKTLYYRDFNKEVFVKEMHAEPRGIRTISRVTVSAPLTPNLCSLR